MEKDNFFKNDPHSPLTPEQKIKFKGLNYFPENLDLRLKVAVRRIKETQPVTMMTSKGTTQDFVRYGRFTFTVDGKEAELTIFDDKGEFFLPFADSLAGTETYPSGRYLEPVKVGKNEFMIDFNQAYNPYCAYNDNWVCPITPAENRLKVPICAGEKLFHPVDG
jgi:uncharacterized protein